MAKGENEAQLFDLRAGHGEGVRQLLGAQRGLQNSRNQDSGNCMVIKVESVNTNNSVIGSISTRGKRVNGSTYTLHNSIVGADNKLYKYSQKNGSYPFKVDDIMILMCSKDDTDGMYNINSFVNLTNGTRKIESKFGSVIIACIVSIIFIFSALGGKITIGYLFFLLIWIPLLDLFLSFCLQIIV